MHTTAFDSKAKQSEDQTETQFTVFFSKMGCRTLKQPKRKTSKQRLCRTTFEKKPVNWVSVWSSFRVALLSSAAACITNYVSWLFLPRVDSNWTLRFQRRNTFFSALIPCAHCLPSTPCYEAIWLWRCHRAHELRALCTFRWGMAPKRKRKRFIYIKFLSILSETLQYRRVSVSVARPCVEHSFNRNVCFYEEKTGLAIGIVESTCSSACEHGEPSASFRCQSGTPI